MIRDEQEQIDAIERDRKRRERWLLLLMLLFIDDGRSLILHAVHDGQPIPTPRMPLLAPHLADAMADAHVAGIRRAGTMAGVELIPRGKRTVELPIYTGLVRMYRPAAEQKAQYVAARMNLLAQRAVDDAKQRGVPHEKTAAEVQKAFTYYGWTKNKPAKVNPESQATASYAISREATDLILSAYAAGNWDGFKSPAVVVKLTGFRHRSIIDGRTSQYCDEASGRPGLKLPTHHPFWATSWPPLHRGCRSAALPIFGPFIASTVLPHVNPQPGYGLAPQAAFGVRVGA